MSSLETPAGQLLATLADTLRNDYLKNKEDDPWLGSPFAWIRTLPSRQRGKVGEQLIAGCCRELLLEVEDSPDSQADLIIEGRRVEIKFSTLWESGAYTFQQIRNQNYEFIICLGVSPFLAQCWVIPKIVLHEYVIGHTPQHAGREGTDTYWLSFPAESPPAWIAPYGGQLSDAFAILMTWRRPSSPRRGQQDAF
ncbi:MAG: hypothetical protein N2441_06175 [Rhodocyclaceae bacterium]|nr:hypothetical protein [Rhodocyclaceae bacterium]